MRILLSPQQRSDVLEIKKSGDVLTINGVIYDFTQVTEGSTLPLEAVSCPFLVSNVERIGGVLHLTLILPHGSNPSQAVAFPNPLINPPDGLLELPK